MTPVNVAAHLARMAVAEPDRPALHVPARGVRPDGPSEYVTLTFRELHELSDRIADGLTKAGIGRGVRTALMVPPSVEFFALTFALLKAAAVPVLIDPGMGVRNLGTCLAEAEPDAFIGIPKAHLARRILGWAKRTVRTTVNVGRGRFFCTHSLSRMRDTGASPFASPPVGASDTAAVLFTSGSTGIAKGAIYTHGIFAAQVEMLRATYGIEPGEVDLCTFPLFALFGPALGMTCVVPDMDFTRPATVDPRKLVQQVRQFGVTNFFGSPAVLRRLGSTGSQDGRMTMPTVRRVLSAGAPVPAYAIEGVRLLLRPEVEIFTPYGATEALPVANMGSREILAETQHLTNEGKGVCVGRPVAGITVTVVPITDEPMPTWDESVCLPPGEIGEFVVRGPVVTQAYLNRPEQTRLAKVFDPATGDTLHRMGDVGYVDASGRLWYCGRKSHRVVTPHGTLFTEMVEGVFNTVPGVARTALVGVKRGGVTYPVLCFETPPRPRLASDPPMKATLGMMTRADQPDFARFRIEVLWYRGTFPVDIRHNAKIFREKLAVWADQQLGPRWNPGAKR